MRTASDFVPAATSGNTTAIDVAAPLGVVWEAMEAVRLDDLRATRLLMAVRSIPARLTDRGALRTGHRSADRSVIEAMVASRFIVLCRAPESILTLGIVGQFWKLTGGTDAHISTADEFLAFARPGFVKSAIDFERAAHRWGTRVTTRTHNQATDPATARRFRRYWLLIGPGSKAIRVDLLRAVRGRAESTNV
jgi:hypothetical protein